VGSGCGCNSGSAIHTPLTTRLRGRVATWVIVDCAELAKTTAMKIKKRSKKDSFLGFEGPRT
jgi:hypothetical protein